MMRMILTRIHTEREMNLTTYLHVSEWCEESKEPEENYMGMGRTCTTRPELRFRLGFRLCGRDTGYTTMPLSSQLDTCIDLHL